ncbi:MAG: DHHA1 domain-containing protein, partial [Clostridia bacterium]
SINDAKKTGAMALFGEKYGEIVRVVKMGDFSTELCGGTHLDNTSKAGLFKIISESSVASGVRRIEAITGSNLLQSIYFSDAILATVQGLLKATSVGDITNRAEAILSEIKVVKKSLETTNFTTALNQIVSALANAETINGIRLVKSTFINIPVEALRTASDSLIAKNSDVVSIFVTENDSKVLLVSGCGKTAIARGAHAGKILSAISPIVGGGGGGRPDSASSGGKDASKISEALAAANKVLASQIGE